MLVGLVSDTHDLFDPALERLFAGVALIIHAGDVVSDATSVLDRLGRLAPVHAVRGNNDLGGRPRRLPPALQLVPGGVRLGVCHDLKDLGARRVAEAGGIDALVCGHSHRPEARSRPIPSLEPGAAPVERVVINPGSAGPRRFRLPRAAALLEIDRHLLCVRIHDLDAMARTDLVTLPPPLLQVELALHPAGRVDPVARTF